MKYVSLFSGIGAFEEGLKNLGIEFDLIGYSEIEERTSKAYSIIHGVSEDKNLGDITKVKTIGECDLVTYGFPCQSFSIAGERMGFQDETNGNLFFETMRVIEPTRPKYLIAENVKGLVGHDKGMTFKIILETLESLGYNNYWKVLNSSFYDTPQARERVFIVSIRKDVDKRGFTFPKGRLTNKTVRDIIDGLDCPRKRVKETLLPYMDRKYFTKNYQSSSGVVKLFDGVSEGYFTSDFTGNRIYSIDGISPTITTKNNTVFYELKGHLNQRERFALQGFRKEYVDKLKDEGIPNGLIDKMSGNSISVNVVEAILKQLFL